MKTALVSDWLVTYAGSERVEEQILACFPDADVYALVEDLPLDQRTFLGGRKVKTSFIQNLPWGKKKYRNYLPLMPFAIEQFDLSAYDLVISSSHAVAKGVLTGPDQLHICYCHSPIRYAWDLQHQYLAESGLNHGIKSFLTRWLLHKIRIWDARSAMGVDYFIANSQFIKRRIAKIYRRDAEVIHPPVDTAAFACCTQKEDFYLIASRMVPYKKVNLIVEAFSAMPDKKLIVIGDGTDFIRIKKSAGPNITFLGYQNSITLKDYMQRAKAFVFAAEEDFGITLVEAQACGTPVIAYGKGGALDSIRGLDHTHPTGVFFLEQTATSLIAAVQEFETDIKRFTPANCRNNAERFSIEDFRDHFKNFVERAKEAQKQ